MSGGTAQFPNFKAAFCGYHRCRPEDYVRKALFHGIPPTRRLLAYPIYLFNRRFFAIDMGILESLGEARSAEEFSGILDELSSTTRVERSIRRGFLGIRVSGTRLMTAWEAVAAYVKAPEVEVPVVSVKRGGVDRSVVPEAGPKDVSAVVVRRLRRAAAEITEGKPVEAAAREAGLTGEEEFVLLLSQQARVEPGLRWLSEQLRMRHRVEQLEKENAALKSILGEKDLELQRVRGEKK